jgi:chromosome segregation ATPase
VAAAVITELLDRITLVESTRHAAVEDAGPALVVGWDGTWRAGSLHGAYRQDRAQLIGASSREAQRQRRLAEVRNDLQLARTERTELKQRAADLSTALAETDQERASVPPDTSVTNALTAHASSAATALRHAIETARQVEDVTGQTERLAGSVENATRRADHDASATSRALVAAVRTFADATRAATEAVSRLATLPVIQHPAVPLTADAPATRAAHPPAAGLLDAAAHHAHAALAAARALHDEPATAQRSIAAAAHRLDQQRSQRPDHAPLARARAEIERKAAQRGLLAQQQQQRISAEQKAAQAHAEAAALADAALVVAGLSDRAAELPAFGSALSAYQALAEDWVAATGNAGSLAARAGQAMVQAAESETRAQRADDEASNAERNADAARLRYEAILQRAGEPYQRIVAEISGLEAQRTRLARELKSMQEQQIELAGRKGSAERDLEGANRARRDAEDNREQTVKAFRAMVRLGMLEVAELTETTPATPPGDEAPSAGAGPRR